MRKRVELKAAKCTLGPLLSLLFLATPSMSQSLDVSVIPTPFDLERLSLPQPTHREPVIVPQRVERFEPDGARVAQRGIIVGKDVAPNVTLGLGFVERKDRRSGLYPNADGNSRRSGKASALIILKFRP